MQKIKIKPARGLLVRDPVTRAPLEIDGEEKPRSSYWIRRISDASVTLVDKIKTKKLDHD